VYRKIKKRLRRIYQKLDGFLVRRLPILTANTPHAVALQEVRDMLQNALGYEFDGFDVERPWGGFFRIRHDQLPKFLTDFFPGLNLAEAHLGIENAELSPKIMVFLPGQRISWQYHHRRTERWHFLTPGFYYRSMSDELPPPILAKTGEVVQYAIHERHRGGAPNDGYALVAEIWQHTDPEHPSDEADVIRLEDDYNRPKHPKTS
jgi:mannose-6-phosphate isomerase